MRISVVMATYNGARYLREQLDSLAAQTMLPAELVVRDDGSTDETVEIVAEFARTSPFPTRMLESDGRLGYGDNFLQAADAATGKLIAFCDQDDVWLDRKLEVCSNHFTDDRVQLVMHASRVVHANLEATEMLYPDIRHTERRGPLHLDPWLATPGFTMVVRSSLLHLLHGATRPRSTVEGDVMSHDEWIYFLAHVTGDVVMVADVLALHRQHERNVAGFHRGVEEGHRIRTVLTGLRRPGDLLPRVAELGDEYARYLEEAVPTVGRDLRGPMFRAADFYRASGSVMRVRAQLHTPGTPRAKRLRSLARLMTTHGYRGRVRGGLDRSSLVRDLVIALTGAVGLG
jgi:glycosyltransferase involved in cell wall biosynthesis